MMRSLLYNIPEAYPELTRVALPDHWSRLTTVADRDDIPISLGNSANVPSEDVLRGLETILKDTTVKETYRFCFFLDARDEF